MKNAVENKIKFIIYNFLGKEKAYYVVDKISLENLKLLSNSATKIEESLAIDYSYQVFLSESRRKIECTAGILKIDDLQLEETGIIYKYKQINQETYAQLQIPVEQNHQAVYAFVKANLVEGNLNFAKYVLLSTGNKNLIAKHRKALIKSQLLKFQSDVELAIFDSEEIRRSQFIHMETNKKISLLELINILSEHRHHIIINLKDLRDNYQYKSVKNLRGSRDINGNLVEPWLTTEYIDDGEYVRMGCFEMNRNTAAINMLITRKVKLIKIEDKTPIIEIAGLLANDLKSYNSYTIVSDGELNIKSLKVKISSKKTFDVLKQKGVIADEIFDFRCCYTIDLNLPLVPLDGKYSNIDGLFAQIAEIKILASIISAHLKEESDTFVPEQLDELKTHYLSQHLYLNFPKMKANDTIDRRVRYKIDIGSKDILNLGKLYSANKFLERRYEVYDTETGEIFSKPSFEMTLRENIAARQKLLSPRMKITKVDELMKPIFDDFLGIQHNGKVASILAKVEEVNNKEYSHITITKLGKQERITALTAAKIKLDEYLENIYRDKISPLVFYVGCTGLLPDGMEGKAMNAIQLAEKYPNLHFSKDEEKGLFFEVGESIIGVYEKLEYYSRKELVEAK
ncbi:hypothetical protein IQ247_13105 [Plectonema cf. radiosum LEGE 06105]|uniref:Uncharacterized protein n=1 Tax=Plectonema cf. radiosum LEGE 06105 TaxID=945769 RepID=A0A8J7FC92_9CYAN|nr:hypothetical protein [Plectonema radiosum]MBE9213593.1 hypothetical protein [Plectonema cf. radiosum LEGE 06105]